MNSLDIKRQNGNVPKTLAGQDHVSGIIFYVTEADIPDSFKTEPVQAVSTIDRAEALGITADSKATWATRVMHYQLAETVRINDGISLYVGIFAKPSAHTFAELATMQNYANGAIRQFGIWDGLTALTAENVTLLQAKADALDLNNAPAVVGYAPSLKSGYQELDKLKIAASALIPNIIITTLLQKGRHCQKINKIKRKKEGIALFLLDRNYIHSINVFGVSAKECV